MPRPKEGYKNLAGQKVPGVHDITRRFSDKNGLIRWAHQEGLKGNTELYGKVTDIGHAVHGMVELDLRGAPMRDIERVPHQTLSVPADIDKAFQSYRAFQAWRQDHEVRAIAFEEAIVSERHQYGGTYDCVAWVDGMRGLVDFKTSKTAVVYLEMRLAMAAHGNLWHERHADLPLQAYHLITLPKDGSAPGHHAFANLSREWEMFSLQLDCWRIEQGLTHKRTAKPATVSVLEAQGTGLTMTPEIPQEKFDEIVATSKPKRTRKPKAAAPSRPATSVPSIVSSVLRPVESPPLLPPPQPRWFGTMGELMRGYGLLEPKQKETA